MKQSSIDWLVENLTMVYPRIQEMGLLVDKAKWMHKEEITNAWDAGYDELDRATASPIKYYHETFNQPTNP